MSAAGSTPRILSILPLPFIDRSIIDRHRLGRTTTTTGDKNSTPKAGLGLVSSSSPCTYTTARSVSRGRMQQGNMRPTPWFAQRKLGRFPERNVGAARTNLSKANTAKHRSGAARVRTFTNLTLKPKRLPSTLTAVASRPGYPFGSYSCRHPAQGLSDRGNTRMRWAGP